MEAALWLGLEKTWLCPVLSELPGSTMSAVHVVVNPSLGTRVRERRDFNALGSL